VRAHRALPVRASKPRTQNKKARMDAGLRIFWLLDLGSNQGPTD
jgi:hypothetical protein